MAMQGDVTGAGGRSDSSERRCDGCAGRGFGVVRLEERARSRGAGTSAAASADNAYARGIAPRTGTRTRRRATLSARRSLVGYGMECYSDLYVPDDMLGASFRGGAFARGIALACISRGCTPVFSSATGGLLVGVVGCTGRRGVSCKSWFGNGYAKVLLKQRVRSRTAWRGAAVCPRRRRHPCAMRLAIAFSQSSCAQWRAAAAAAQRLLALRIVAADVDVGAPRRTVAATSAVSAAALFRGRCGGGPLRGAPRPRPGWCARLTFRRTAALPFRPPAGGGGADLPGPAAPGSSRRSAPWHEAARACLRDALDIAGKGRAPVRPLALAEECAVAPVGPSNLESLVARTAERLGARDAGPVSDRGG